MTRREACADVVGKVLADPDAGGLDPRLARSRRGRLTGGRTFPTTSVRPKSRSTTARSLSELRWRFGYSCGVYPDAPPGVGDGQARVSPLRAGAPRSEEHT